MSNMLGGYELAQMDACGLPEVVASGFTKVTQSMLGAKYVPVLYVGQQVVCGVNYMIICKQTLSTAGAEEHLVKMVINCAPDDDWSIVEITRIV